MFTNNLKQKFDVSVVGGAGHIGLPLSILLASKGHRVIIYDLNREQIDLIAAGVVPFMEQGAEQLLHKVLQEGTLALTSEVEDLKGVPVIITTIGTPVDEFLNPVTHLMSDMVDMLMPILHDGQTLILRSTVSPGLTEWLEDYIRQKGKNLHVAFCPERVVQGRALEEMQSLPQIISGVTPQAEQNAAQIFGKIAPELVRMKPKEAEFAKLFNNAYRYIQFAAANEFYMLATSAGLDFSKIQDGMMQNYPRCVDLPRPGFAAGPCLFKDTMQLAAFDNNKCSLGYDAMKVNEGLPQYLLNQLKQKLNLDQTRFGLLGMAFKANSDDRRSSLSYKIKKNLQIQAKAVYTTDVFVKDDADLLPVEEVVAKSDILILCAPHSAYKSLDLAGKPVVDIWNFFPKHLQFPLHEPVKT